MKGENSKLLDTIENLKMMPPIGHKNQFSFGGDKLEHMNEEMIRGRNDNNQGVDDLVAHFENFNMEDLGATGSPVLQRSMTERNPLSPKQAQNRDAAVADLN